MAVIVLASVSRQLGDALSRISSVLAVPVLIAAIIVLLLTALELGRYLAETIRRRRSGIGVRELARQVLADPASGSTLVARAPTLAVESALREVAQSVLRDEPLGAEYALDDFEQRTERQLDRTRMLVRAGPAVGLMGTLIPLAPGLRALGRGDVALLSTDLRIAFAATVMGLLAGTVAFALTLARTRTWSADLVGLERATAEIRAIGAARLTAEAQRRAGDPLAGTVAG